MYLTTGTNESIDLPLFESGLVCVLAPSTAKRLTPTEFEPRPLIPARKPRAGEQYRFHFDMTKCIGCQCCVVACSEQNGNPAAINWRRVGELEGGHYPHVRRHHLSMGCNHCLEPSCLNGCPVEAYTKDAATGVVIHNAEACIGCQYCTWNCSYGVPQYNADRGVVGKCDLCHNRLADDMAPACVNACPESAIAIEIVNIADWRRDYVEANAPGLPSADDSISTTRVTLPDNLPPTVGRVDTQRVRPEHPHWPLVFMLVLTQLAAGAFTTLAMAGGFLRSAVAALAIAAVSLSLATLHLGRPAYAWRALKGLRRSWLSREVLALGLFAGASAGYVTAIALALGMPWQSAAGAMAALLGLAGATCSARIYMVPARPAWDSRWTIAEFFATAAMLGPMLVWAVEGPSVSLPWVARAAAAGAAAQLLTQTVKHLWLSQSDVFELRGSARLLSGQLRNFYLIRLGLLLAAMVAPLTVGPDLAPVALALALVGELLGRWLFFVSVVPKNIAAAFLRAEAA